MEAIADMLSTILSRLKSGELVRQDISRDERLLQECEAYNETVGTLGGYDCSVCKNRGFVSVIREEDDGYKRLVCRECECMVVRLSLQRIEKSGLGELVERCTLENYHAREDWQKNLKGDIVRFLAADGGEWLYMGGQVGSGKTHLCTAALATLIRRGMEGRYMMWRDEVVRLKAKVLEDEYSERMEELKNIPVLYIDDLFKSGRGLDSQMCPTVADLQIAFEIINYRSMHRGLITIVSSELHMAELCRFDEGLGSRINERARGFVVEVKRNASRNYRMRASV